MLSKVKKMLTEKEGTTVVEGAGLQPDYLTF